LCRAAIKPPVVEITPGSAEQVQDFAILDRFR
jgi:hypothetical protein